MDTYRAVFYPDNRTIEVQKDTTILSAALAAGISINSVCGGDGVCGRCKVIVRRGTVVSQPSGSISQEEKKRGVYLACLTTIHSDVELQIPPESRADLANLSADELAARLRGTYSKSEEIEPPRSVQGDIFKHSPLATKINLSVEKPALHDNISDLERIYRQIRKFNPALPLSTGLVNIRQLGELLRDSDWNVTVTLGKRNDTTEIVLIEPGNTSGRNFGMCFDIGTTTISGQLVDLNSKQVLGTKASYNRQAPFGSDVITRIIYAKEADGLEQLHNAVVDTMNQMIDELTQEHSVHLNDVTCVVCAGNTTMMHLLLSIDPANIRKDPYVPTANFLPVIRAKEASLNINPRGLLACVPGVASYVGGDITAGILSSGVYKEKGLSLLIDIGTNGEIVLGNDNFMVGCAASAGPAFEGSGVKCGMRATTGAIQKVFINPSDRSISYTTIGNAKPRGICGSGYIDLLAQMIDVHVIDKGGKIILDDNSRVRNGDLGREFVVAAARDTEIGCDIVITEADIDNLKRAKGAIYAACASLLKGMGEEYAHLDKIFIAGGFGTFLDIESSIRIGLLPDLDRSKFLFIGNSSLAGAREVLLSSEAMSKAENIARTVTYFELSVDPGYMDEYMAALFFPHTDLSKFPSLRKG